MCGWEFRPASLFIYIGWKIEWEITQDTKD
jgi:hypothetical protein